jgi:PST family polysaccharide transporter
MTAAPEPLARSAARGVAWAFLATLAGKLVWLGGLAVLARVLAPEVFGLLAFGLVYVAYLEAIGDLGTSAALIYWPARDRASRDETAQATFVVNLGMGAGFFAATQLLAPAVAAFFHHPEAEPILRALAWAFPLKALGNTHDALLQKALRFRRRAIPELALAVAKTAAAVALALAGFGVWSLVWGQLLGLAAWTLVLWGVVDWRPGLRWPAERLRPVLAYGRGIVAVNVLAAVVHHVDLVVVGRMLGATALGFYQVASKLPEMTVTVAVWVVARVLFPTFARVAAAGGDLAAAYLAALRYTALATLPAAVGLALVAEPLVAVVYGSQWGPSGPLLRALAVYAGLRAVGSPAGDLLKATGRSGLLAVLAVVKAAVLVPALVLAAREGSLAVATTLAGVTGATALLNLVVASRLAPAPPRRLLAALAPAVAGTLAMAAALAPWHLGSPPLAGPAGLAVQVAVGATVYLLAVRVVAPDALRRALSSLGSGRPTSVEAEGR